ncbi:MAG: efflux RND transporter periplasmic adaptor subunit [Kiritimatiellia bacterium]|nr:efflux RND transporter periplasmic adaptor subunit [Lentisphaerota bacterium]
MDTPHSSDSQIDRPTRRRQGRLLLNIAIILAILLVLAMMAVKRFRPPPPDIPSEPRAIPVATVTLQPVDAPDQLIVPGRIEPWRAVEVPAVQPGQIVEIPADKGDLVTAGKLLLRQDQDLLMVAEKRSSLLLADSARELQRRGKLQEAGAMALNELEALQTRHDLAEAELAEARLRLTRSAILSPIDGLIDRRYLELGEYAREGDPLFRVIEIDRVKITCHAPERDISAFKQGQKALFTVDSIPDMTFTGTIAFVAAMADPQVNAFPLEITASNPGHRLRPGMIARVQLDKGVRKSSIVVPLQAIITRKGEHIVFQAEDGHARSRAVTIDAIFGASALLSDGLEPGAELIVEGHRALIDGMPVSVITGN